MATAKKLRELRDYKDRRRRHRDISNFRKHIYLDEVTDRHEPYKYFGSGYGRLLLSKDKDIRQLQIEVSIIPSFCMPYVSDNVLVH